MISPSEFLKWCQVFKVNRGGGGGGGGDVVGPASSTDRSVVVFDGTTGKLVASASAILDVAGVLTLNKVFAGVLSAQTQLVGPTASYTMYVSQFQSGVGSGTVTDPYSDPNSVFTTYSPGLTIAKFDVGSFALPAVLPVNIVIEGAGQNATTLTGTSLGINQGSWSVGTNPYITFRNLTVDFTTSSISPTTYKSGSVVAFENCRIKTGLGFNNFENLILNNCTIESPTIQSVNNIFDRGSTWTSTVTITDTVPTNPNVQFINLRSDDASFSGGNITLSFANGTTTTGVIKLVNSRDKLQTLTYGNTGGSVALGFLFAFDATSYPVTITSPTSSAATISSIENWAQVLTAYPTLAGNNVLNGQNSFRSPLVVNSVVTALTGNTGTISAPQLTTAVIEFSGASANATWALPTAVQMDSQIGSTQPVGAGMRGIEINNQNNFTLTITAGTNFNLGLMSIAGTLVIPANTSVTVGFTKTAMTPTYSLYGNSNNPQGSGDVTAAGDNTFIGQNKFLGLVLSTSTEVNFTANSGSVTAGQLLSGKNLTFDVTGGASYTLPTGTAIDAALNAGSPGAGIGFTDVMLTNRSNFTIVFTQGVGTNFNGLSVPGSLILGPHGSVTLKLVKDASTDYIYYGSSGVSAIRSVIAIMIGNPANVSYSWVRMPFSGFLVAASAICQTGTFDVAFSINATPVTATPNSVSTTNSTQAITGANTFTAGDYLNFTVSNVASSPARAALSMEYIYYTTV